MCGIGSITFDKTVGPGIVARLDQAVSDMLLALDHRGGDACGLLSIRADGRAHILKAPTHAHTFNKGRGTIPANTRAVAIHTRMATQGEPCWNRNNHPVAAAGALVMHNGIVWDDHIKRRPGEPEVDTYALALAAASAITRNAGETTQQHAERMALEMAQEDGSAAVLLALRGKPFLMSARLSDSPLYACQVDGVQITASTYRAVEETAEALGLTIPTVPYTYSKIVKKAKKGRPPVTKTINSHRKAIDNLPEGDVLTWNAGTHTAGHITIPLRYQSAPAWQHNSLKAPTSRSALSRMYDQWADEDNYSYTGGTPTPETNWDDERISTIAARMLEANEFRCELCDDTTATKLTPAYGLLCCDPCLRSMDATPDHEKEANTNA